MYPRQRGAASSLQAFISLSLNAIIAGVIAAAIGANALMLATTTAAFSVCAGLLWWHHQRRSRGHAEDRKSNTSELQSLMRISYAVFCLKKKNTAIDS